MLTDDETEVPKAKEEGTTSTEEWTMDSDEPSLSTQERAYFISSAANIRRRELHGQPRYKEEGIKKVRKTKMKRDKKKIDQATLKDLQEKIQRELTRDDRGVKTKNRKRSVNSVEKWKDSEIWNEIVAERERERREERGERRKER